MMKKEYLKVGDKVRVPYQIHWDYFVIDFLFDEEAYGRIKYIGKDEPTSGFSVRYGNMKPYPASPPEVTVDGVVYVRKA